MSKKDIDSIIEARLALQRAEMEFQLCKDLNKTDVGMVSNTDLVDAAATVLKAKQRLDRFTDSRRLA